MENDEEWDKSSTASIVFEPSLEWTGLYNKEGQKLFPPKSKLGFIKNVALNKTQKSY